jgi:transposase
MFYDFPFKKSILTMYLHYKEQKNIQYFISLIQDCFSISKSTFYTWLNNNEISNYKVDIKYDNKNITPVAEEIIFKNKKKSPKKIKKLLSAINIFLNTKSINYVIYIHNQKNNVDIKSENNQKNLKKENNVELTEEYEKFIIDNAENKIKDIKMKFNKEFNEIIHEKQIVNILHKYRKKTISFFKISPEIEKFIKEKIKEKSIYTSNELSELILKEFKIKISLQSVYKILKKNNYVYKKIRRVNNPYTIKEQVEQFKKVNETHNLKNINNCVSIDEISVIENSLPERGWFLKNESADVKINNPKIISKRYTILMACTNKKHILSFICEKGMKKENFLKFIEQVSKLVEKDSYFLLDNASIHKSKIFKEFILKNKLKVVYNAPYHSETNPIENVFSIFRNKLNRNETKNIDNIIKVTTDFALENNEKKFKNIFEKSIINIEQFIKNNDKKD